MDVRLQSGNPRSSEMSRSSGRPTSVGKSSLKRDAQSQWTPDFSREIFAQARRPEPMDARLQSGNPRSNETPRANGRPTSVGKSSLKRDAQRQWTPNFLSRGNPRSSETSKVNGRPTYSRGSPRSSGTSRIFLNCEDPSLSASNDDFVNMI